MTTLEYYFAGGCHVVLDKYTMDPSGNIIHLININILVLCFAPCVSRTHDLTLTKGAQ